jgi:hypothetical protein
MAAPGWLLCDATREPLTIPAFSVGRCDEHARSPTHSRVALWRFNSANVMVLESTVRFRNPTERQRTLFGSIWEENGVIPSLNQ